MIFAQPKSKLLLSADALWEKGFGVAFSEAMAEPGFDEAASTQDLIEIFLPCIVVPAHGLPFFDVATPPERARCRPDNYRSAPARHTAWSEGFAKVPAPSLSASQHDRPCDQGSTDGILAADPRKAERKRAIRGMDRWILRRADQSRCSRASTKFKRPISRASRTAPRLRPSQYLNKSIQTNTAHHF